MRVPNYFDCAVKWKGYVHALAALNLDTLQEKGRRQAGGSG